MELTVIEAVLGLGGTGVLAVIIFLMYRRDRNCSEKTLADLTKRHLSADEKHSAVLEKHSVLLTELIILVKNLNGRAR
ncbi:hypothetical protein LCGC14_3160040 [marine sediment metagenome]|uniref:Uncharacterized protein n=1 Tax=marine sediment metagenome TaxID=412755 RepID=A0A0F8VRI5_9ZZZZ